MRATRKTGYEIDIFVTEPNSCFLCLICRQVLREPYQCKNGHATCKTCVLDWFKEGKTKCPGGCGLAMSGLTHMSVNRVVGEAIDNFLVKCNCLETDRTSTCPWIGTLQESMARECDFNYEGCPYPGCNARFPPEILPRHRAQCTRRTKPCQHCTEQFPYAELSQHEQQCDHRPVSCDCRMHLPLCDLPQHKDSTCPLTEVSCPLFANSCCDASCTGKITRGAIGVHVDLHTKMHWNAFWWPDSP